ncbi:ankyrin repeat domain-containing protein [uncultured Acinetobacter sp.]|uniref:ankyrin repeat domain-containing protein n=1 Tax=uncultured Acinetobacter sp. TaxID=165433 RepID=UPI002616CE80|nr:ankyrin repeat domain-containing protein [uncultured Acinetobacter sp.]
MNLFKSMLLTVALGLFAVSSQAQPIHTAVKQPAQQELIDLYFAAARTGKHEVIQEFLKHGFPVDIKNHDGYTALMMASYYGHQDIVTTLIEQGADRCLRDNKGNTALMGAIFKLEWSIAKQLKNVDCDVNAKQTGHKTVTEFAKVIGQDEKLQQLLKE